MKKILIIFLMLVGIISAQNSSQSFYVSTNSSSTTLDSAGIFTGKIYPTQGYNSILITVLSDVGGTIKVEYGDQSGSGLSSVSYRFATYTASDTSTNTFIFPIIGRYFRVIYTNDTTAQTSFSLRTFLSEDNKEVEVISSVLPAGAATEGSLLILLGYEHPSNVNGGTSGYGTLTTETDTMITTATVWWRLSISADDSCEVSYDGGTIWHQVSPYGSYTTGYLYAPTFTEVWVRRKGGAGTVNYTLSWEGY